MSQLRQSSSCILALCILSVLAFGACSKDDSASSSISPADLSETANAATEQAIAMAQNFDAANNAFNQPGFGVEKSYASRGELLQSLMFPVARATTACNAGGSSVGSCPGSAPYTVTRTYSNCGVNDTSLNLSGTATYTYSNSGCSMIGVTSRSVTRTENLTLAGKSGGTLTVSSANFTDFRGNSIGGGQTLTVNASAGQFSYAVAGVTRTLTGPLGTTLFNITTRTTAPMTGTGTSLSNLSLSGGTLEVIHNKSKYTLTLTANNIGFSNSCACPVSGSMSGTYSGLASGTATITYTACGKAVVTTSGGANNYMTIDACTY